MTAIDTKHLRALAEAATPGPWDAECDEEEGEVLVNAGTARTEWTDSGIGLPARSWRSGDRILEKDDLWDDEFDQVSADADYIAAIDPPTLLALLDELESPRKGVRWYTAAYRDPNGNVIQIGVENVRRSEAEHVVEEFQRGDPEGPDYFIATRIQPPWEPVTEGETND